ncbi:phage tail tape measure protein [Deinococcus sedimenti]|uniref:Phage tail tape measure protein domain-containing protein n=1 Tax=Deinococcus sedimenti TaxID=1867090 RepID=A0ABQ2S250_9DEIO|nr:phage tail tape measure protein [Deinococcus sedimenti]GGR84540.1 hypothetical protein GCM10008960_09470 [Deinococcus sedimenti]
MTRFEATATFDSKPFESGVDKALKSLTRLTDFAKKEGTLKITAALSAGSVQQIRRDLASISTGGLGAGAGINIKVSADQASVDAMARNLRRTLSQVVSVDSTALNTVNGHLTDRIRELNALITQLRALGGGRGPGGTGAGGAGGVSAQTRQMLEQLRALNAEYVRGEIDAGEYQTRLVALQTQLRAAASTAAAGSAEFRALDGAITRTVTGLRSINSSSILKLRADLAGARAEFDAASAAATNAFTRNAAIDAFRGKLVATRTELERLRASGTLTTQQLSVVNNQIGQINRTMNTIGGGVNTAGLSGNIKNALGNISQFIPGVNQLSGAVAGLPPAFAAAAAGAIALGAAFAASFRTAADFQQKIADIKAITGVTGPELYNLSRIARTAGRDLGVGATEAADGVLALARAGLTTQQILDGGLTAALNLAGAAGIQVGEAANLMASAMTAFALSGAQANIVADSFANFANATVLGASDLSLAIAAVGPTARTAGIDLQEFGAIMATLAQGGFRQMSDAGTSLKTLLISLSAPSAEAGAQLKALGVNIADSEGNLRPVVDVMEDLKKAVDSLDPTAKSAAFKAIFGQDAIRAADILTRDIDKLKEMREEFEQTGTAANTAKTRLESFKGETAKLSASAQEAKIALGEQLLPAATDLVKGLNALISNTDAVVGFFKGMTNAALTAFPALRALQLQLKGLQLFGESQSSAQDLSGQASELIQSASKLEQARGRVMLAANQYAAEAAGGNQDLASEARERLKKAREDYQKALAEDAKTNGSLSKGAQANAQAVQAQTAAVQQFRRALEERQLSFQVEGLTESEGRLKRTRAEFARLRQELEAAFPGNLNNTKFIEQANALEDQRKLEVNALKAKVEEEAARKQAQAARDNAELIADAQARVSEASRNRETAALNAAQAARLAAAKGNALAELNVRRQSLAESVKLEADQAKQAGAERRAELKRTLDDALAQEGVTAEKRTALQRAYNLDLKALEAQEAADRIAREARRVEESKRLAEELARTKEELEKRATEAQARLQDALAAEELAKFDLRQARLTAATEEGTRARIEAELKGQRERAALVERQQAQSQAREEAALKERYSKELAAEGLSAADRLQIQRLYEQDLGTIRAKGRTEALANVATLEQAERDAVKRLQDLQDQAAQRQADQAGQQVEALRARQGLLDTAAQRLDAEREIAGALNDQLAVQRKNAADSTLSGEQRQKSAEDVLKTEGDILQSQKAQRDLLREVIQARFADELRRGADALARVNTEIGRTTSSAGKLALERQKTALLREQADLTARQASSTDALLLTEEQRRNLTEAAVKASDELTDSQRRQVELTKAATQEARSLAEALVLAYSATNVKGQDPTAGVADALRETTEAARELDQVLFKLGGTPNPEVFGVAQQAIERTTKALDNQATKVKALTDRYRESRDVMNSLSSLFGDIGAETQDLELIEISAARTRTAFAEARQEFQELLAQGAKADPAKVQAGLAELQRLQQEAARLDGERLKLFQVSGDELDALVRADTSDLTAGLNQAARSALELAPAFDAGTAALKAQSEEAKRAADTLSDTVGKQLRASFSELPAVATDAMGAAIDAMQARLLRAEFKVAPQIELKRSVESAGNVTNNISISINGNKVTGGNSGFTEADARELCRITENIRRRNGN